MRLSHIGQYNIIRLIGVGGMGMVYLAEDTYLDREVALKVLPEHLNLDPDFKARFSREAKTGAKINHPHVVRILGAGEDDGRSFMVMEYVDGRTLDALMASRQATMQDAIRILLQICDGLEAAHALGITHRDIKPANILLDTNDDVKVGDFGLANLPGATKLTRTGSTMGTIAYMSPEQVHGEVADHRSDIFSLGVIAYEMLTHQKPFAGSNDMSVMRSIAEESYQSPRKLNPSLPQEVQVIIEKALKKDKKKRYQSVAELRQDLKHLDAILAVQTTTMDSFQDFTPFSIKERPAKKSTLIRVIAAKPRHTAVFMTAFLLAVVSVFAYQQRVVSQHASPMVGAAIATDVLPPSESDTETARDIVEQPVEEKLEEEAPEEKIVAQPEVAETPPIASAPVAKKERTPPAPRISKPSRNTSTLHTMAPIVTFSADETTIYKGTKTTLRWTVAGANTVSISPGQGTSDPAGTRTVSPYGDMTYTLVAEGDGGRIEKKVRIRVIDVQYEIAEKMPELIGGLPAIQERLKYPQKAKASSIEGACLYR